MSASLDLELLVASLEKLPDSRSVGEFAAAPEDGKMRAEDPR